MLIVCKKSPINEIRAECHAWSPPAAARARGVHVNIIIICSCFVVSWNEQQP